MTNWTNKEKLTTLGKRVLQGAQGFLPHQHTSALCRSTQLPIEWMGQKNKTVCLPLYKMVQTQKVTQVQELKECETIECRPTNSFEITSPTPTGIGQNKTPPPPRMRPRPHSPRRRSEAEERGLKLTRRALYTHSPLGIQSITKSKWVNMTTLFT